MAEVSVLVTVFGVLFAVLMPALLFFWGGWMMSSI